MRGVQGVVAPFGEIPDYFRRDIYSQIFSSSLKSENIQFVALKGLGKSLILRLLESNQEIIKKNLRIKGKIVVYLCDLSMISDNSTGSILKHIFARMLGFDKIQSLSPADLTFEVQKYFKKVKTEGKHIVFILDSIEKIEAYHNSEVFSFLHALYKQNMDFINFVFSVDSEVDTKRAMEEYGELGRLMFDRVMFLNPLNTEEQKWFLSSLENMPSGSHLAEEDRKIIFENCGGYPVTIKRMYEAKIAGWDLNEVVKNPSKLPSVAYNFDIMLGALGEKLDDLKKLANNKGTINEENIEVFRHYYLINKNRQFVNKVLMNYLVESDNKNKEEYAEKIGDLKLKEKLTASEYKILDYLYLKRGEVVGRGELIEKVWGTKADNGISEHALDQIISRLRKKVIASKSEVMMETLRGRGYRIK